MEKSKPKIMRIMDSYTTNRNESFLWNVLFILGITGIMFKSCGLKLFLMFNNARITRNAIL